MTASSIFLRCAWVPLTCTCAARVVVGPETKNTNALLSAHSAGRPRSLRMTGADFGKPWVIVTPVSLLCSACWFYKNQRFPPLGRVTLHVTLRIRKQQLTENVRS